MSSLRDIIVWNELVRRRRREYHREYNRLHAAKFNARARHRQQIRHCTTWLLANLEWPVEPTPIYPDPYPIRRPILRLPRKAP